ncbi:MAG: putative phage integrase [Comamonadaceae bacterium]|nr:MAG: putative phage integrase [Comamonadaceae bacterium]
MQQQTKLDSLWALSRSFKAEATLSRIMALCCDSTDTRFPFSVITFISSRESIGILSNWSTDNIHCSGLHRLAQICWNNADLGAQIRPFGPDQRVEKMFRMDMEEQYLASMTACRRALPADEVASWLQVLRLYVLVRALDALESSVTREAHLHDVCRTLRYVSETTGHERRAWIDKLAGSSTSFFGFESETLMRCRSALADTAEPSARSFFNSLISILEHRPWSKLPVKSTVHGAGSFDPYSKFHFTFNHFSHAQIGQEPGLEGAEERDRLSAGKTVQETDPAESDSKRRFNGEKLRLEMLEKYLFLPHSWHHISSDEEVFVFARLKELLNANKKVDRFGAAVAFLALLTGQSINDTSKIRFGTESGIDWRLNIAGKSIHKLAPRFSKRWNAPPSTNDHEQWVMPLSEGWEYKLMGNIAKPIIQALRNCPSAGDLDEVWQGLNPEAALANWFGAVFANSEFLTHLSGPSTASRLSLKVFQQSQDHASARLLSSDHRTALPSACAYGSYRGFEVAELLGGCLATDLAQMVLPPIDEQSNALLRRSIAELTDRVNEAARPETWCEHHNLLTALAVLALLSSTGTRPVNSPFQSLAWFDLERGLIYVQDKVTGPTQGSRICILSDFAKRLLQEIYLPHLRRLCAALLGDAPKFSKEVERVLRSDPEAKLPLFFFLRQEPTFDWMEVSESQLDLTCRFNWPLPWNLFRHFSSTQLRRLGLHADIRDALLGHAERDAESHGDFSGRIPLEDFEVARPLLNRLQDDIEFSLPKDAPYQLHIATPLKVEKDILQSTSPFGREARAIRRQKLHQAVQAIAKAEVLAFLGARTVDQLSSDEFDQIARQMLMRKQGLPHVMGSLRYEVFENFLSSEWRAKGRHAKLRRRYVLIKEGRARPTNVWLISQHALNLWFKRARSRPNARCWPRHWQLWIWFCTLG